MISLVSSSFNAMAVLSLRQASHLSAKATENLATVSKLSSPRANPTEAASALRTHNAKTVNSSLMQNLAGALSYSETQAGSLRRIAGLFGQLNDIVSKMHDSIQGSDDLNNYMIQFNALRRDIVQARKETYGGIPLHDRTGTSVPLRISLDGSTTNVLELTQSNFLGEGAGALLALLGSSIQDFEVTQPVVEGDSTDYGGEIPDPAPSGGATGAISGEEGWGTESTNTPEALIDWGVEPLDSLLSSVAQLLSVNSSQQQRIRSAIDQAMERNTDLAAFEGRITDVDVAMEVLNLAKSDLRTQAGTSAMAQANSSAASVAAALYGGAGAGIKWYSSIL
jgi:flagellin